MVNSRRKGASGEREVLGYLRERLGDDSIQRNLTQSREGGGDCAVLVGGMVIEVKRWGQRPRLHEAIQQAERAAERWQEDNGGREPVTCVAYRCDGDKWRFLVNLGIEDFCLLVREGVFDD